MWRGQVGVSLFTWERSGRESLQPLAQVRGTTYDADSPADRTHSRKPAVHTLRFQVKSIQRDNRLTCVALPSKTTLEFCITISDSSMS